jgi:hypothetical protein
MLNARRRTYGSRVGAIRAVYRRRSRLVTGSSPARGGKSTLSRLVTLRSRPKTCHTPPDARSPSSSRRASSPAGSAVALSGTAARAAGWSERHIRSGSALTSSLVRPLSTERGWSSGSHPPFANSSFLCSSSHRSRSPSLPVRTSTKRPRSFSPNMSRCSSPPASARPGSSTPSAGRQVPASHTMTSPPPYPPAGMIPSKSMYSMGWSSTWKAARRAFGSSVGPLGTAQLASTPSISRRKS